MRYKYFTSEEVSGLNPSFVWSLDYAREMAGVPFVITSGFRTPAENAAAGGAANSAHLRGLAVDLRAKDSRTRFRIIYGLIRAGFTRIVVYKSDGHIHVDWDESLPQDVFVIKD